MHIMLMSKNRYEKEKMVGRRFGRVKVRCLSDRRAPRGKRTVPLWECICDCGATTYKSTDTLTNRSISMCSGCAQKYAAQRMREKIGLIDGTEISRIKSDKLISTNTSGARGVYYNSKSKKWRARLRFKGKTYNLGSYKSFDDAVKARKNGEEKIYGEFLEKIN